ncbi:hypothetical protein [Deinococcus altitudinis]|uniref:hypothetical protein n=1 Tax=Deinococcus altitudinis TaxID=468914 RepID=UPI003892B9B7
MKFTSRTSLILLPLLIAACAQPGVTTPAATRNAASSPALLGYVEITSGKVGPTDQSVRWVTPTADGFAPLTLTPSPSQLQLRGDKSVTWSFDDGKTRYLSTTLDVRNVVPNAQDTRNVYFLAVDTPQTIGDTAISAILNDDGKWISDLNVARRIFPTHDVIPPGKVQTTGADFVAFSEDEIQGLAPAAGGVLFPWGFGVRHCLDNGLNDNICSLFTRTVPASDARNSYDAIVTFSYQAPVRSSAQTPDAVKAVYAVYKDVGAQPRITQSIQEQGAGTVAGLATVPSGFYATKFPGNTLAVGGLLLNLRISGPASGATSTLLPLTTTPPADPCPGASGTNTACFGNAGRVNTSANNDRDATRLDAQGRILVAGSTVSNFNGQRTLTLSRYAPSGSLDTTFGTAGTVSQVLVDGGDVHALAIAADGKIVVVGDGVMLRYTSAGTLDTSFGTSGVVKTPLNALSVAVAADNKIVLAGYTTKANNDGTSFSSFALARYTAAGVSDGTFGNGGATTTTFGGSTAQATSIALTTDNKVVVTGQVTDRTSTDPSREGSKFTLVRYTSAGTLDGSFGTGGKVSSSFGGISEISTALALTADGAILAVGDSYAASGGFTSVLAKYTSSGQLDGSFGAGGKTTVSVQGADVGLPSFSFRSANALNVTQDGKILVVGTANYSLYFNDINSMIGVVRFTPSGQLDRTFASNGVRKPTASERYGPRGTSVSETPTGKILVAGVYSSSVRGSIVLEEINP